MDEQHRQAFEAAKKLPPELVSEALKQVSQVLVEGRAIDELRSIQAVEILSVSESCQSESHQEN